MQSTQLNLIHGYLFYRAVSRGLNRLFKTKVQKNRNQFFGERKVFVVQLVYKHISLKIANNKKLFMTQMAYNLPKK